MKSIKMIIPQELTTRDPRDCQQDKQIAIEKNNLEEIWVLTARVSVLLVVKKHLMKCSEFWNWASELISEFGFFRHH
jgi:hypothetical protein